MATDFPVFDLIVNFLGVGGGVRLDAVHFFQSYTDSTNSTIQQILRQQHLKSNAWFILAKNVE